MGKKELRGKQPKKRTGCKLLEEREWFGTHRSAEKERGEIGNRKDRMHTCKWTWEKEISKKKG